MIPDALKKYKGISRPQKLGEIRMENYIREVICNLLELEEIGRNDDLFEYGMDSLAILKLVADIEDQYEIEIEDEDLSLENMQTMASVISMVSKYVGN